MKPNDPAFKPDHPEFERVKAERLRRQEIQPSVGTPIRPALVAELRSARQRLGEATAHEHQIDHGLYEKPSIERHHVDPTAPGAPPTIEGFRQARAEREAKAAAVHQEKHSAAKDALAAAKKVYEDLERRAADEAGFVFAASGIDLEQGLVYGQPPK